MHGLPRAKQTLLGAVAARVLISAVIVIGTMGTAQAQPLLLDEQLAASLDCRPGPQSLRVFRARPSSAFERRPVQSQSAAIAGYGEHLQRRLGVFGRDERA